MSPAVVWLFTGRAVQHVDHRERDAPQQGVGIAAAAGVGTCLQECTIRVVEMTEGTAASRVYPFLRRNSNTFASS
jgi:hypothetical protein